MMMKNWWTYSVIVLLLTAVFLNSCDDNTGSDDEGPTATDFTELLTNQVNEVIIPTMQTYQTKATALETAANNFSGTADATSLSNLQAAYQEAYLAYQAAAVHNFYATANQALIETTNLYPIDVAILDNLISSESYNFSTSAQQRANGFPALDYLLYGNSDVLAYFNADSKRVAFLQALSSFIKTKSDVLVSQWTGTLKDNFIANGGTELGSSISEQLNKTIIYYEDHIRENKVGIPIGLLGPNDSPIPADATKIEAYHQAQAEGNEAFTLALLKAGVEEIEDMYLGSNPSNSNGQGYDDLLLARQQSAIDTDIKAQFSAIYDKISNRNSISGDDTLYTNIQALLTLFKSDLFPVLNVEDADGGTDGD